MTLGEIYSIVALIFASNFKSGLTRDKFERINDDWILKNETLENLNGRKFWYKSLNTENYIDINKDFKQLNKFFDLVYFMQISRQTMDSYFLKLRFEPIFDELSTTHISNFMAFISSCLKHNFDDRSFLLLRDFINDYFLPNSIPLSHEIRYNCSTNYYKALSYFLEDFCNMLSISFNLK